jgi:hypothetical protein
MNQKHSDLFPNIFCQLKMIDIKSFKFAGFFSLSQKYPHF